MLQHAGMLSEVISESHKRKSNQPELFKSPVWVYHECAGLLNMTIYNIKISLLTIHKS